MLGLSTIIAGLLGYGERARYSERNSMTVGNARLRLLPRSGTFAVRLAIYVYHDFLHQYPCRRPHGILSAGLPATGEMVSNPFARHLKLTHVLSFSEADKLLMVERVRGNDQGIKNPVWVRSQVRPKSFHLPPTCLTFAVH